MEISATQLRAVLDLYEQGRSASAYRLAASYGPLTAWRGAAARVVAGRVAMNVGSPRLGRVLHALAYREAPTDPEATYYAARGVLERRGTLAAWRFLRRHGDLPDAPPPLRADWFAFHAYVLSWFRDFETADHWLARAESASPDRAWVQVERANVLERRDRYPDALAASRRSLELHPWYRPAVQQTAHLLLLMGRDDEALDLLSEASQRLENAPVSGQLALLLTELGKHAEARQAWERVAEVSVLMEDGYRRAVLAQRADAAYYCDDHAAAIALGRESTNPFHVAMADELERAAAQPEAQRPRRVLLPVPFVRQHHMTCAPATLSAIARFWSMPADHLDVAEEICYDGTPAHSERRWAEAHAWVAREFTVTADAARALVDRGVPFTLTTTEPTSAHLQAVIGYDGLRGTLLIRDPFDRTCGEFITGPTLARYAWTGPRGMALVPADRAHLLDGIDLAEAALYDDLYRLQLALERHDRHAAGAVLAEMEAKAPEHRLSLNARRTLAHYDGNPAEGLAVTERMLRLHPDVPNLLLSKLSLLRILGLRDDRLALLKSAAETPVEPKSDGATRASTQAPEQAACRGPRIPLPLFWTEYARELRHDARQRTTVLRLLHKALRYMPMDGWLMHTTAGVYWDDRQLDEATQLYRFACTMQPSEEEFARAYFIASRHLKQVDAALNVVRHRVASAGTRSSNPAQTLFWALEELDRVHEAFASLDLALKQFGDEDGGLLLFAAGARARYGQFDAAEDLLKRAEARSRRGAFLRAAAELAQLRGDASRAKAMWHEVLQGEPLAMDAHRSVARLITETDDRAAAIRHLADASRRFPQNYPLHQLWASYLHDEGPAAAEPVIRSLLQNHPDDPWALRELIWALCETGRVDEALAATDTLLAREPSTAASQYFRGRALLVAGRREDARAAFRHAVSLSVDAEFAARALLDACDGLAAKRDALAFIRAELVRQTIFGEALFAFRQLATELWPPERVLEELQAAFAARPDLWHAWSAVARQLAEMNRLDEALPIAVGATERFPLLPRLWYDLAHVHRLRGDAAAEEAALRQAIQIAPAWSPVVRRLADALERRGELTASRDLLVQATARAPLDAQNHGGLADVLWKLGHRKEAVERIARAAEMEPAYDWAWDRLREWAPATGQPHLPEEIARRLAVNRGGDAASWVILAQSLTGQHAEAKRLAAFDKALALDPRRIEAVDLKAEVLAKAGRFDEAEATVRAAPFGDAMPTPLRGRLAWIAARRGDRTAAIAAMRDAVAEDPNYYWGWWQIANWCRDGGDKAGRLEAASALARSWPHDPAVLNALAEARETTDDRAGAKSAYARALELDPANEYAGNSLFDHQLADKEFDAAAATLAVLLRHCSNPRTKARQVQLAAKRDDRLTAMNVLGELCTTPWQQTEPLSAAVAAVRAAGWRDELATILREALRQPNCQPTVADRLVNLFTLQGKWHDAEALTDSLGHAGPLGEAATRSYLHALANAPTSKVHVKRLRRFVRRRRGALRGRTALWGTVGYALHSQREYRATVAWLADWRDRANDADLEGWMLVNLAEALRALGRASQAKPVNARGHEISPAGSTPRGIHTLWLAADALLARDLPTAEKHLAAPEVRPSLGPSYHFMATALRGAVEVAKHRDSRKAYADAVKQIAAARAKYPDLAKDIEQRRLYRQLLRVMARRRIGVVNRLRCLKQSVA